MYPADHYLKLMIGDAITTIAILRAKNEELQILVDAAHAALEAAGLPRPDTSSRVTPFPAAS